MSLKYLEILNYPAKISCWKIRAISVWNSVNLHQRIRAFCLFCELPFWCLLFRHFPLKDVFKGAKIKINLKVNLMLNLPYLFIYSMNWKDIYVNSKLVSKDLQRLWQELRVEAALYSSRCFLETHPMEISGCTNVQRVTESLKYNSGVAASSHSRTGNWFTVRENAPCLPLGVTEGLKIETEASKRKSRHELKRGKVFVRQNSSLFTFGKLF
jgi:hypothetical protein